MKNSFVIRKVTTKLQTNMIRIFSATSLKLQGTRTDAETIKPLIDHYAESQVIRDCDITEPSNIELSQNLQKFERKMPIFPFDSKFTETKTKSVQYPESFQRNIVMWR